MSAPTDLPTMLAEIRARIYRNGIGAITAVSVQGVLADMLAVLGLVATAAAKAETDAEIAALTPGIIAQATSAGSTAGQAVVTSALPGFEAAVVTATLQAVAPDVALAASYAEAALASENAAQAILNSYLDDGIEGLSPVGSSFDDGVEGQ